MRFSTQPLPTKRPDYHHSLSLKSLYITSSSQPCGNKRNAKSYERADGCDTHFPFTCDHTPHFSSTKQPNSPMLYPSQEQGACNAFENSLSLLKNANTFPRDDPQKKIQESENNINSVNITRDVPSSFYSKNGQRECCVLSDRVQSLAHVIDNEFELELKDEITFSKTKLQKKLSVFPSLSQTEIKNSPDLFEPLSSERCSKHEAFPAESDDHDTVSEQQVRNNQLISGAEGKVMQFHGNISSNIHHNAGYMDLVGRSDQNENQQNNEQKQFVNTATDESYYEPIADMNKHHNLNESQNKKFQDKLLLSPLEQIKEISWAKVRDQTLNLPSTLDFPSSYLEDPIKKINNVENGLQVILKLKEEVSTLNVYPKQLVGHLQIPIKQYSYKSCLMEEDEHSHASKQILDVPNEMLKESKSRDNVYQKFEQFDRPIELLGEEDKQYQDSHENCRESVKDEQDETFLELASSLNESDEYVQISDEENVQNALSLKLSEEFSQESSINVITFSPLTDVENENYGSADQERETGQIVPTGMKTFSRGSNFNEYTNNSNSCGNEMDEFPLINHSNSDYMKDNKRSMAEILSTNLHGNSDDEINDHITVTDEGQDPNNFMKSCPIDPNELCKSQQLSLVQITSSPSDISLNNVSTSTIDEILNEIHKEHINKSELLANVTSSPHRKMKEILVPLSEKWPSDRTINCSNSVREKDYDVEAALNDHSFCHQHERDLSSFLTEEISISDFAVRKDNNKQYTVEKENSNSFEDVEHSVKVNEVIIEKNQQVPVIKMPQDSLKCLQPCTSQLKCEKRYHEMAVIETKCTHDRQLISECCTTACKHYGNCIVQRMQEDEVNKSGYSCPSSHEPVTEQVVPNHGSPHCRCLADPTKLSMDEDVPIKEKNKFSKTFPPGVYTWTPMLSSVNDSNCHNDGLDLYVSGQSSAVASLVPQSNRRRSIRLGLSKRQKVKQLHRQLSMNTCIVPRDKNAAYDNMVE